MIKVILIGLLLSPRPLCWFEGFLLSFFWLKPSDRVNPAKKSLEPFFFLKWRAAFAFVEWKPLPPQLMQPANGHFSSSSLWIRADLPATTHTDLLLLSFSIPLPSACVCACTGVRARTGFLLRLSRNVLRIPLFRISPEEGETGREKKGDHWWWWWWWWALVQAKSFPLWE